MPAPLSRRSEMTTVSNCAPATRPPQADTSHAGAPPAGLSGLPGWTVFLGATERSAYSSRRRSRRLARRHQARDDAAMIAAFSITPLGIGESVGAAVAEAIRLVRASGLPNETNAMFTNVEGEWDEVMNLIKSCVIEVSKSAPSSECGDQGRSPTRIGGRPARQGRCSRIPPHRAVAGRLAARRWRKKIGTEVDPATPCSDLYIAPVRLHARRRFSSVHNTMSEPGSSRRVANFSIAEDHSASV